MQRSERDPPPNSQQSSTEGVDPLLQRQKQLATQLRAAFAHVAEEPVPDEFLVLINRLGSPNDDQGRANGESEAAND